MNFEWPVRLSSFQRPHWLQSVSIFFKFAHLGLLLHLLCYLHLLLTFFSLYSYVIKINLVVVPTVWSLINLVTQASLMILPPMPETQYTVLVYFERDKITWITVSVWSTYLRNRLFGSLSNHDERKNNGGRLAKQQLYITFETARTHISFQFCFVENW